MKIVLLSAASSIHTIRWANGLSLAGHQVHVVSQHPVTDIFISDVNLHILPYRGVLGYFTMVLTVKKLLQEIKPDIVNAHYASGYGTTARLIGYHPWILSVWGSDVYDFPYKSLLHKYLVKTNIMKADLVASTSHCMAQQTRLIAPHVGDITITPFGVDTENYLSIAPVSGTNNKPIVIGTIKTMAYKYGIDTLIKAFALLYNDLEKKHPAIANQITLRLVGDGPQLQELKQLAVNLNIHDRIHFIGAVPHHNVPNELSHLDIYIALSRLESFGVAIIEAGAAGRPVIVSDAGGLPEVTLNGITGIVVPKESPQDAANALKKLILEPDLRQKMGDAGKTHVTQNYNWEYCIKIMLDNYDKVLKK
ncbi:glycosyltransferase [Xenorhabdus bovienii]|uniref:glycosyltransferase n=1 Tax=Xenorhabdus bovienii TaxID=40576 RepID=UPI0023B2C370|nr:glycosyltransferase [Xenorhabdus bovienii]MDE9435958.1 glycosyltransferase [Xenorhabdus bovienii]MDE9498050.1 glycosyltransferase [Xenorhabdus bovienii]